MKRNLETGFSLIESVAAMVLLSVVIYGLSYFSTRRYTQLVSQEHKTCIQYANATLDKIKSIGTVKSVARLDPQNNRIVRPSAATNKEEYLNVINANEEWLRNNETLWDAAPDGTTILKNYKALVGSMALLNSLYNRNNAYCQSQTGATFSNSGDQELVDSTVISKNLKNIGSSIRIQPYNLNTGATLPCNYPLYVVPGRSTTPNETKAAQADITTLESGVRTEIGFLVTVHSTYDNINGESRSCSVNSGFSYPSVAVNPDTLDDLAITVDKSSLAYPGAIDGAMIFNSCFPTMPQAHINITTTVPNFRDKRAMSIMCRDRSTFSDPVFVSHCVGEPPVTNDFTVNSEWVPCRNLTVCGQSPIDPPSTQTADGFSLRYANLNMGCNIMVEAKLLDAEQNYTLVTIEQPSSPAQRGGCTNICPAPSYTNRPGTAGWCPGGGRTVANSCDAVPAPTDGGSGDGGDGDGGGGDGDGGSGTDGSDSDGSGPDGGDGDGGDTG